MSSHREAPAISKDPAVDNTDVYAFVSPDAPDTVTLVANYLPGQVPYGGPNFYEFDDDAIYEIHVSNRGDAEDDVTYRFQFRTEIRNKHTFLYNTGPIDSIDSTNWNRPQFYNVWRVNRAGTATMIGEDLAVPPVNVGVRSTPNYADTFTADATHSLPGNRTVFAGQRGDPFFVDLGSIFDLGGLRPFNPAHEIPLPVAAGMNALQGLNVHTIAIQVPLTDLTRGGVTPTGPMDPAAVIGVYASASRRKSRIYTDFSSIESGPFRQVSRLGNPLFNEVIVPMSRKDFWNAKEPSSDHDFAGLVAQPELAKLLPALYPNVFPHLAAYKKQRADLLAILLTGIPSGIIPGFQNFTGTTQADLLRLNVAIPPTTSNPSPRGILGGDLAGFPNGRRLDDNIVTIELQAIAGATIPLVDPSYVPDAAAMQVNDGTSNTNAQTLDSFPYVGTPAGGYQTMPGTPGGNGNGS